MITPGYSLHGAAGVRGGLDPGLLLRPEGRSVRTTTQILAAISSGDPAGGSLPDRLCSDCAENLDLTGAGMTLMNDAGPQAVVGASGPLASRLEELQLDLGEGPAPDASRANRTVAHDDLSSAALTRWPGFAPAAVAAGVWAVTALPLQVGGIKLGSLCMYRASSGRLDDAQATTAHAYASAAVVVLLHLQDQMWPVGALHPELAEPVAYRAVIHQATGFLSVTASVGMAEALLLMRAHAFAAELPLLNIARDILSGRLRLHPEESEE
jgi:hypothetical protein